MTFDDATKLHDTISSDPESLTPDDFIIFLVNWCTSCRRWHAEHPENKCLFDAGRFKPIGLRAAIRYKRWAKTWLGKENVKPDQSFWKEEI